MVEVDDMDALPDTKYVVVARAVGKNATGQTLLRYRVAPHPFGNVPNHEDEILTVEDSKITTVYTEGYSDKKDDDFLENMLAAMSGAIKKMKKNPEHDVVKTILKEEQVVVSTPIQAERQEEKKTYPKK